MSRSMCFTMSHRFSDSRLLGIRTMSYKRYSTITFLAIYPLFQVSIHKRTELRTLLELLSEALLVYMNPVFSWIMNNSRRRCEKQMTRIAFFREWIKQKVFSRSLEHIVPVITWSYLESTLVPEVVHKVDLRREPWGLCPQELLSKSFLGRDRSCHV